MTEFTADLVNVVAVAIARADGVGDEAELPLLVERARERYECLLQAMIEREPDVDDYTRAVARSVGEAIDQLEDFLRRSADDFGRTASA